MLYTLAIHPQDTTFTLAYSGQDLWLIWSEDGSQLHTLIITNHCNKSRPLTWRPYEHDIVTSFIVTFAHPRRAGLYAQVTNRHEYWPSMWLGNIQHIELTQRLLNSVA